jgi:hypothetical protein
MPGLLRGSGHLLCRHPEGRRPVYQQTVIDTYSKLGFAKLYDSKTPVTAAEVLNDRVLLFFDEQGIIASRMLTDRGIEHFAHTAKPPMRTPRGGGEYRPHPDQGTQSADQRHLRAVRPC